MKKKKPNIMWTLQRPLIPSLMINSYSGCIHMASMVVCSPSYNFFKVNVPYLLVLATICHPSSIYLAVLYRAVALVHYLSLIHI